MKMLQTILSFALITNIINASDSNKIDISNLDKIEVLQALFLRAQPQGMSYMHYSPNDTLSTSEAKSIIKSQDCFADYVHGRVMKVYVCGDTLDSRLFNRDNGPEAAEKVIASLRKRHRTQGTFDNI